MQTVKRSLIAVLVIVSASSAANAGTIMDGKLPVYSNVTLPPGLSFSDPRMQEGLKLGIDALELNSPDSEAAVDAWYRSRLSWCKRHALPGKAVYVCGDSSVRIDQKAAGSSIMILPGATTLPR